MYISERELSSELVEKELLKAIRKYEKNKKEYDNFSVDKAHEAFDVLLDLLPHNRDANPTAFAARKYIQAVVPQKPSLYDIESGLEYWDKVKSKKKPEVVKRASQYVEVDNE